MKLNTLLAVAALAAVPAIADAQVGFGLNIRIGAPPPERVETIPPPPAAGWIWIRGHYAWRHRRWVWVRGHYEAPRPGMTYVPGHWANTPNGYVWQEGYWAPAAPAAYIPPSPPPAAPAPAAVVVSAPPPPYAEAIPPSPGPEFFWIRGHWDWRGRWVWVRGYYARHPHYHYGARWVDGYWGRRDGGWVWIGGHWE